MERLVEFFAQMPTWQRLVWVAICITAAWIAEDGRPLFHLRYRKWSHASLNLTFFAGVALIGAALAAGLVGLFDWVEREQFGLLNAVGWPIWLELLIAVLALDLAAQYLAHFLLHKIGWMWRFHLVHHSDREVDATTGTRIHPGDYAFRELFAMATVVGFGIPMAYYFFYRTVTVFFTYATHANINMPRGIDRALSYVFVTPNMHKFHHHHKLPWTDRNYGNVFSIWDRLFGTFVYDDVKSITYGVESLDERIENSVINQLRLPFGR